MDPSVLPGNPGRALRNLLAYVRALHPSSNQLRVLCWRDAELPSSSGMWKSRFRIVKTQCGGVGEERTMETWSESH